MQIAVAAEVFQTFLTIKDGQPVCTTTINSDPSPAFVVVRTVEGYVPIPDWYFSAWGIMTSSECSNQLGGGIASENVAVLSLTATATTTLQGSSPGPGASNNQPLTSVLGPLDPSLTSGSTVPPRLTQPTYHTSAPALAPTLPSSTRVDLKTSSPAASLSGLPSLQPSDGVHTATRAGQISSADLAVVDQSHEVKSTALGEPQLSHPGAENVAPDEVQQVGASSSPPLAGLQSVAVSGKEATGSPAPQNPITSQTETAEVQGGFTGGQIVSLAPSATALVVGLSAVPLSRLPAQEIVNDLSFSRGPGTDLVVGTQIISPGAPAVTISGTPVSIAIGGTAIVVGSSTKTLLAAPTQDVIMAGTFSFNRGSGLDLVIGTQTIEPGAPAVTISGTPVSLPVDGTAVVIDGSTSRLSGPTIAPAVVDINGISFTAHGRSAYVADSQTLLPGEPAINIHGTSVSLAVSATAVVIAGSTVPLIAPTTAPARLAILGNTYTAISGSSFLVGSQILIPGRPAITVSGTPVSLPLEATAVVIGDSTMPIQEPASTPAILTINGQSFEQLPGSKLLIKSQTLIPGGPAITISGTPFSLPLDATAVVIGGSTIPIPNPTSTPVVLEFNGQSYTQISGSGFLIGSRTLVPGGAAITVSGTPFSLPLDATAVVIGGSTIPIPNPTSTPVVLEFNGQSYTQISGSGFLIGSRTLVPGGAAITVNGTLVSLGVAATNLVVGTQTESLTTSRGLGAVIMGGFSDNGPSLPEATGKSNVVGFTGGSDPVIPGRSFGGICVWLALSCILVDCF
ncbi:MAG: hypothetical protein LQ349_000251 [Xanthoria aureola]|nr:MAG: hypothetical protein LQ349_000251 [Xanthoria aureola]